MFRKLFISLLILSALASEGITNFPVEFYSIYLADIGNFDYYEANRNVLLEQFDPNTMTGMDYYSSLRDTGEGLFVLSTNSAEFLTGIRESNQLYTDKFCTTQHNIININSYVILTPEHDKNVTVLKDIIFTSSDNSPPFV